jgi:Ca-activated chloride channel family protein
MNEITILPDDPRLTAYALGELEGEERVMVEAAVRGDPTLRSAVDNIRAMARSIETALAAEAGAEEQKSDGGSQTAVNGGGQTEPVGSSAATYLAGEKTRQRGRLLHFPSLYFVIGSLAAACFAVMVVLHETQPRVLSEQKHYVEVQVAALPTASGPETQAPIGQDLPKGSTSGTLADATASFHFDAKLEKPTVGIQAPPVVHLMKSAPGTTWAGGSGALGEAVARANPPSLGGRTGTVDGIAQTRAANDLKFGGPGSRLFASNGAFAGPVVKLGETDGASPFGSFSRPSESTERYYVYPPDEKFVYRAIPYGSLDLLARPMPQQRIKSGALVVRPAPFNTEDYAQIRDNDFAAVAVEPLSTFGLDVDTASYSNLRRFLEHGGRPPRDAVRIEELVNYFPYRYAPPASADVPFAASIEVAAAPWNPQHRLVRIGLKARETSDAARPAANLVFLVDVSGSMAAPAKLPLVQESLRLLVGRLRADDRVAIVTYATQATLALPATPVAHAADILAAVDALTARGSTNGAMGLQLAYDVAKANVVAGGVNRVILCTDGDFNVGVTGRGDLVRLIEEKAKSGVFLTVLGFGTGNLKDATLEQLASKGNGFYGYVDSAAEAKHLLVEQAGATLVTVAKDVKVQVEFNPAVAGAYRLIGYENRLLRKQDFTDDRIDAGEIGAGHTVTALYEVVPVGATAALRLADTEPLRYRRADGGWRTAEGGRLTTDGGRQTTENQELETRNPELGTRNSEPGTLSSELLTVKIRYKEPDGSVSRRLEFPLTDRGTTWADASDDFKFAASVASFGMILRESPYKGTATLAAVAEWARQGLGSDAGGQRNEFLGLVSRAQTIVQ